MGTMQYVYCLAGSFMITTPMGARRHYTQSYGDFYNRWDSDSSFRRWFDKVWPQRRGGWA